MIHDLSEALVYVATAAAWLLAAGGAAYGLVYGAVHRADRRRRR